MGSIIPLLTEYEKEHISERQALPEKYLGLSDAEMERRIAAARATLGRPARHPRPSLSARRGDQVRRLHRRLVPSCPPDRAAARKPTTSCSAACTSWPRAPTSCARRISRSSCRTWPPAARWPTWPSPSSSRSCWEELTQMGITGVVPVTYINSAAAIKSFVGERGGTVCTSSNAMATLKWALRARREDPVPAGSASRAQHRLQDGHPARRDGRLGSERDLRRPRSRAGASARR